jgi:hypothetical protein
MEPVMSTLTELQLRDSLRSHLARSGTGRIVEELGIEQGAARIDVALVTDRLLGFEIKSDRDKFDRLANQIHAYNRVFDEITLVTGMTLREEALRLLPSWWGVMAAEYDADGVVQLAVMREAQKNPLQDSLSLAMLLWKAEAIELLSIHYGRTIPSRWANAKLHALLAQVMPVESLQRHVATKITSRAAWRTPVLSEPSGGLSHLAAMSTDCPK